MSAISIILLLLGIAVFIASFVLPEQKNKATESDHKLSEELIKEKLNQELEQVKSQIQDTVDETISYSVEKTERSMERLTNEKIQAINDYSDTVLEEINKNHKEVLFLYDMLNDKQTNLQETVKTVNTTVKEVEEKISRVQEKLSEESQNHQQTEKKENKAAPSTTSATTTTATVAKVKERTGAKPKTAGKSTAKSTAKDKEVLTEEFQPLHVKDVMDAKAINDIDIVVGESGRNNNEKILELHKSGKSKMAIAKELGLGVGEVKLVIDLFEGM
ncbi:MAG: DUF6115 domain-containing protein [Lachnospiraceae bacterium]|nr:DUF6115 domain-containing protein [Lachnospiraceae bacterium]